MSAILSGTEHRAAFKALLQREVERNARRRAETAKRMARRADRAGCMMETAHDYATHALSFWPNVGLMEQALSSAPMRTRDEAKRIIRERRG